MDIMIGLGIYIYIYIWMYKCQILGLNLLSGRLYLYISRHRSM